MAELSDITILVTSFLRPGYLEDCLDGIRANLPECAAIIIDDSSEDVNEPFIFESNASRHKFIRLPFDSGLPAKRNAGVRACKTKYFLLGCDDFRFDREAREGIMLLLNVLENHMDIAIASGRVDSNPYEGFLEYVEGEYIQETRLNTSDMKAGEARGCDLTVNYFLGRAQKLRRFEWDEDMLIGGEHGDYFLMLKQAMMLVVYVHGANITTFPHDPAKIDPRYPAYRARARSLGHEIFLKKRNIKQYIGF